MQLTASTHASVATGLPAFLFKSVVLSKPTVEPWRVVRVRFGTEPSVASALEADLGLEVFCPRYRVRWVSRGRRLERQAVFLPTYVFARFDPADPVRWHEVHDLDGVLGLLPGIATDNELARLTELVTAYDLDDAPIFDVRRRYLPIGSKVQIVSGPFAAYAGRVTACDGVTAWVKIFGLLGREVDVNVPADRCQIESADPELANPDPGVTRKRGRGRGRKRAGNGRFRRFPEVSLASS